MPTMDELRAESRPCRVCGALILFRETRQGKAMPLDLETIRKAVVIVDSSGCSDPVTVGTPHWATCPGAAKVKAQQNKIAWLIKAGHADDCARGQVLRGGTCICPAEE